MDSRRMRVSDAERERVASFLREQSLEGRLDHDELDERLGGAYQAKTAGELEDLIEDLPHRRVAAPARPAPRRRAPARRQPPPIVLVLGLGLIALLTVPTLLAGGVAVALALIMAIMVAVFVLGFAFGPFILIGVLISQAVRRRRASPRHWTPHC